MVNHPAETRITVLALLQEAEQCFERVDMTGMRAAAARAVNLARELGDGPLIGRGLMLVGRADIQLGHSVQAYEAASEAYDLLGDGAEVAHRIRALNICGTVLYLSGETGRAIELLRRGLAASAHTQDSSDVRWRMLNNMTNILNQGAGELEAAIQCATEAVEVAKQATVHPACLINAMAVLAQLYLRRADALADQGLSDEAAEQLDAAAKALPPLDLGAWRSFSFGEHIALTFRVAVLAALGRWPQARWAAAATLRTLRRPGSGHMVRANGFEALAELHRRDGKTRRAVYYETQALAAYRALGDVLESPRCLVRLANLHAVASDYDRALACRKELKTLRSQLHMDAGALRRRLVAIEREADRRRHEANEALAHTQRLAVIGRLIAQTHHALSAPIAHARALATQALKLSGRAEPANSIPPVLDELNLTIDRAAGLVSQLKLFSYRAAPRPMALSLRDALLGAWQGVALHVSSRAAQIEVIDNGKLQVWCDAQRLGIMLKVLSIELAQPVGPDAIPAVIRARIEAGAAATVVLHIQTQARATPAPAAEAPAALGITLCREITSEMGGSLHVARDDNALLHYRLQLPDAGPRAQKLPSLDGLR